MRSLGERLVDVPSIGVLTWIGVRPEHDAPMRVVDAVAAVEDRGLEGDLAWAHGRLGGKRQVTLVQEEHLPVIASLAGVASVTAPMLRRNLAVRGINLLALVKLRFSVGEVVLVGTGPCAPCGKMDEAVGPGGFQAMRGHGGITARVERGGRVKIGDSVRVLG